VGAQFNYKTIVTRYAIRMASKYQPMTLMSLKRANQQLWLERFISAIITEEQVSYM